MQHLSAGDVPASPAAGQILARPVDVVGARLAPMALLAELTHRCPLRCPYCSNPLDLQRASAELSTAEWCDVLDQAAAMGVLQVHFSGGEPMVRRDLLQLVARAASLGLYSNLITSGVLLGADALAALDHAGIDHIQLSFQDVDPGSAERIGGMPGAQARKLEAARLIRAAGLPLTLNFVVHRQNLASLPEMLLLAERLDASRVEVAHTQYYGWGLLNRNALLPSRAALDLATAQVEDARRRYLGRIQIDYVTPDYHAGEPKACMAGWGRRFINISPAGRAMPCHAAETIPGMAFPSVRDMRLAAIWQDDPAFNRFRGTQWMPALCQACDRREIDWGGCRCQALALAGDAAGMDPVCDRSASHGVLQKAIAASAASDDGFMYRGTVFASVTE